MKTIEYGGSLENIKWPDGFQNELSGKTISEQMERYRVTYSQRYARTSYGEIDCEDIQNHMYRLDECDDVLALVTVHDLIVGVQVKGHWGDKICLPYQRVTTYYASDNDGAGYKEREDIISLIPVPDIKNE